MALTFLNLGALFGLAAVSIPIIIHFLNKLQVKEVTWAAMRFLRESLQKNRRRLQIEDLLLLALRCLLIILLILALSQPALRSGPAVLGSHQVTAVLILDDSYSMGLTNGVTTSFQRGQSAAEQILAAFPSGSSAALFFAADNVQPVVPQPTFDFNLLRSTIRQAKLTDRATNLSAALQSAMTTLQAHEGGGGKEIYLITDGQASGWPSLEQVQKQIQDVQNQVTVHLVLVGDSAESNLGITALQLDSGLTAVNQPLRCSITALNSSETEARDVRVSLSVDDQPAMDETIISSIPPKTSRSVVLFAKLRNEGFHTITAQIPHDRLPADDQRSVAVRAIHEVRVLLVNGTTGLTPSESDDFFVRNALVPVAASEVGQYFLKTTTVSASALAGAVLDDYDAIFFLDVDRIDQSEVTPLNDYVRKGGGLVIFPGPNCDTGAYNQGLGSSGFLPARISPSKGDPDPVHREKFFTLQTRDYDHPITSLWNDPSAGTLANAHFYSYYPLSPSVWASPKPGEPEPTGGRPRVILRFAKTDDPAAVEHTWGSGRVVLFASSATTVWNDLPVNQAFVPLLQRTLGFLVARQDEGLNIQVGQKFSYGVNNDVLNKDVSITVPGQTDSPRVIGSVALVNNLPTIEYSDTDLAGPYRLTIASDPPTIVYFAAQADSSESNLAPLSADQLKTLGDSADIIKWSPDVSLTPKLTTARIGTELWVPLLIAALIVGTLETFVAQYFSRSK